CAHDVCAFSPETGYTIRLVGVTLMNLINRWTLLLVALIALGDTAAAQYAFTNLVKFTGNTGIAPGTRLALDTNGNVYGTTIYGGSSGEGSIFEVAAGTNTYSTLASFPFPVTTYGGYPSGGLIADTKGNLYGATDIGGATGHGTVFELPAGTNSIRT